MPAPPSGRNGLLRNSIAPGSMKSRSADCSSCSTIGGRVRRKGRLDESCTTSSPSGRVIVVSATTASAFVQMTVSGRSS